MFERDDDRRSYGDYRNRQQPRLTRKQKFHRVGATAALIAATAVGIFGIQASKAHAKQEHLKDQTKLEHVLKPAMKDLARMVLGFAHTHPDAQFTEYEQKGIPGFKTLDLWTGSHRNGADESWHVQVMTGETSDGQADLDDVVYVAVDVNEVDNVQHAELIAPGGESFAPSLPKGDWNSQWSGHNPKSVSQGSEYMTWNSGFYTAGDGASASAAPTAETTAIQTVDLTAGTIGNVFAEIDGHALDPSGL